MDKISIRGGKSLSGRVWVSGSKNASLPILASCLAVEGPVRLESVPRLADTERMLFMLEKLGVSSEWHDDGSLRLEVIDEEPFEAPYHLVKTMRASFCLLGPLWARRSRAKVSYPGGCIFGHRPVDLHLKGLAALGANIELIGGDVHASGPVQGGHVFLGGNFGSTVLGTANVLMAAVLAKGQSMIECAAMEPEIGDLCRFLNTCGAKITGIGTHRLLIEGVTSLHGCTYRLIPDRIEAGTLLIAALITRGEVVVLGARPDQMGAVLDRLRAAGARLEVGEMSRSEAMGLPGKETFIPLEPGRAPLLPKKEGELPPPRKRRQTSDQGDRLMADRIFFDSSGDDLELPGDERNMGKEDSIPFVKTFASDEDQLRSVDVVTMPYPGFPTDLQAQFMALMCVSRGTSILTEKIYPERFIHVAELNRLGARIRREGPTAIVPGDCRLMGATVMASDLRASAALVLAGLIAEGKTEVQRVYHLDRGYENLVQKLAGLGADIERVKEG